MSDGPIKEGDKVQWNWSGGKPGGKVDKIETHGELEIESKGKLVKKNASADNPAVKVVRSGNNVVKRASELQKTGGAASGKKSTSSKEGDKKGEDTSTSSDKKRAAEASAEDQAKPSQKSQKKGVDAKKKATTPAGKTKKPKIPASGEQVSTRTRSRAK